jgi:hypothetical protein
VRCASPYEILRLFSFPEDQHIDDILWSGFSDYVLSGLSSGLPFVTANVFARHIFDLGAFPCSCQPFSTAEDIFIVHLLFVCIIRRRRRLRSRTGCLLTMMIQKQCYYYRCCLWNLCRPLGTIPNCRRFIHNFENRFAMAP